MQAFIIESANRPGEFARSLSAIATRDINVTPIALGIGSRGGAAFGDDESAAERARHGGLEYRRARADHLAYDSPAPCQDRQSWPRPTTSSSRPGRLHRWKGTTRSRRQGHEPAAFAAS